MSGLPLSDDDDNRPPKPRLTEEQRRALIRSRVGIASVDKDKLWEQRQGANALAKRTREHS